MINNLFSQSLLNRNYECKVGSVFTTLAVSLERYFAVCKPLWIRIRRTPPVLYIVIVTLFAFGFNIPKFMEFEVRALSKRLRDAVHFVLTHCALGGGNETDR